jgi:hypothetical protein
MQKVARSHSLRLVLTLHLDRFGTTLPAIAMRGGSRRSFSGCWPANDGWREANPHSGSKCGT